MKADNREFHPPQSMTPGQVADHLARLVWESFSDFIADGAAEALLGDLGLTNDDGVPTDRAAEELLIFFMWAHTRGAQLAFVGHAPDGRVRKTLDAFHAAVFEDMKVHGTPPAELPIFEQRVSARYAEYHDAAARSDALVGAAAVRALVGDGGGSPRLEAALARRAIAVANPLQHFLEEVELVDDEGR